MKVAYARKFLRSFRKLPSDIQDNFRKKEKLFRKEPFHFQLRTHKLKGREEWSFLVTYSVRVLFLWEKDKVIFINIGDHSLYRE